MFFPLLNFYRKSKLIKSQKRGFSLMELIVVFAMMGILMSIAMPRITAYTRSVDLAEAKYNHQTIVYCIREWSLGNYDKKIVPGNFTVQNDQGKSVADYLAHYNKEYYDEYLKEEHMRYKNALAAGASSPTPIDKIGGTAEGEVLYEFSKGTLTTSLHNKDKQQIQYDGLKNMSDSQKDRYIKK